MNKLLLTLAIALPLTATAAPAANLPEISDEGLLELTSLVKGSIKCQKLGVYSDELVAQVVHSANVSLNTWADVPKSRIDAVWDTLDDSFITPEVCVQNANYVISFIEYARNFAPQI